MSMENVDIIGKSRRDLPTTKGKEHTELSVRDNVPSWSPIRVNPTSITEDFTLQAGSNGQAAGPFEIEDGVSLTIEEGSTLVIV